MNQITRRSFVTQALGAAAGSLALGRPLAEAETADPAPGPVAEVNPKASRPNIVYLIMEDISPALGCYGQPLVRTPRVDRLASQGIRFSHAFCTAPVCSASRSAIFTGCYQTAIGGEQHRTWEWNKRPLPAPARHLCDWYRAAGYFTCNLHPPRSEMKGKPLLFADRGCGKIDLNFTIKNPSQGDPFDGWDWTERRPGQPFFAHLTIFETHKGPGWKLARRQPRSELVDPAAITVPPFYPDDPIVRDEMANFLDVVHLCDGYVGRLLDRLEREGLAENTIVVLGSDHGALAHGKQFMYDDGLRVPLIIRFPDGRQAGRVDDRMVSSVDLAPTMLGLAGIKPPAGAMHGYDLFHPAATARDCIFAARDRMDIAIDRMRAVRTRRYKYIRNELPAVPYMQHIKYEDIVDVYRGFFGDQLFELEGSGKPVA